MISRLLPQYKMKKNYGLRTFLIALLTACIIFVPFIIYNGGIFYYYGDFNVQEIPFYQLAHDSVKSGNIGWSNLTDLGSDFLSSYSFYLLGSPFFWLTIPFPSAFVPYLIGPLLILKFACCALSAYIYIKRYTKNKSFAVIGGLLYAFSGFAIYNVFFFHFHEPMIIFPLLLAALDSFVYDKKRLVFAVAVFSACVVNYYFFTGQVLFVIMYYIMLMLTKTCKFSIKEFLLLAVEVVIGFLATAFILLPSVLGVIGNPRVTEYPNGWDSLVYSDAQKYWLIISAFFFPADMPAFPTFTPDSNCKWASVAGWLPLFGMTGVIAFLQQKHRSWLKKLITLLILFAFVPVLNSAFQLFNSSIYYARWYYMIVLMLVLATVSALQSSQVDWNRAIRWSTGITFGIVLLIGLMPFVDDSKDDPKNSIGVAAQPERFWIYSLIALASILTFVLILKKFGDNKKKYTKMLTIGVLVITLISSGYIITYGSISSGTTIPINKDIINKRSGITIKDIDNVRSDFYECVDNTQMFWQIQSINCFQSSVSSSIMKFYNSLGITRDVASRPDTNAYGLRSFLSCKYLFDYSRDGLVGEDNSFIDKDGDTKMANFEYLTKENGFDIYENKCYIPMGYTFDKFITNEEFDNIDNLHKTEAINYALVLSKEQMKKYSSITKYDEKKYSVLYGKHPEKFLGIANTFGYDTQTYKTECKIRAEHSCSEFNYTKNGFTAKYNNTQGENLLFFSVPYSSGFSATVNDESVDVEQVTNGFMAIKIPANTKCNIVFNYETPGFSLGLNLSLIALAMFVIYAMIIIIYRNKKKK